MERSTHQEREQSVAVAGRRGSAAAVRYRAAGAAAVDPGVIGVGV
jgi:hypothetical protein